tara:strand:- start:83 stop:634 length:552 start_codon:yes stop_codon:yes gene_type:complete
MNNILNKLIFSIVFLSLSTSYGQVKSQRDKDTDFSKIKTYSFAGWLKGSETQITNFDKKRIYNAFRNEFDERGISFVETGGDVTVTLFIVIQSQTSTTAYTEYIGGYGYVSTWGYGYGGMTTYDTRESTKGTLVIDMYDNSKKKIWQGVISSHLKDQEEISQKEKQTNKKIKKLMKKYPVKIK